MAFTPVEITPEMVLDAMAKDGTFNAEMWEELAERLNMGRTADDFADMVASMENKSRAAWIIKQFEESFRRVKSLHLSDD